MKKKATIFVDVVIESITLLGMKELKTKITKCVRLSDALIGRAERLAKKSGLSQSDILRMSFEAGIPGVENLLLRPNRLSQKAAV